MAAVVPTMSSADARSAASQNVRSPARLKRSRTGSTRAAARRRASSSDCGGEAYDDPRVRLRLGAAVERLDTENRTVQLADGEVIGYDEPVRCGEVVVTPGDLIFADFDGIVVGAPVLDFTGTMVHFAAINQAMAATPVPAARSSRPSAVSRDTR